MLNEIAEIAKRLPLSILLVAMDKREFNSQLDHPIPASVKVIENITQS